MSTHLSQEQSSRKAHLTGLMMIVCGGRSLADSRHTAREEEPEEVIFFFPVQMLVKMPEQQDVAEKLHLRSCGLLWLCSHRELCLKRMPFLSV